MSTISQMTFEDRSSLIVQQARILADRVESWWAFSNLMSGQSVGILSLTFPDPTEREAFVDSTHYEELQDITDSLMDKFGVTGQAPLGKSGRFVVRIPKTIHQSLATEAKNEGVSLNQLVVTKLAVSLGRQLHIRA